MSQTQRLLEGEIMDAPPVDESAVLRAAISQITRERDEVLSENAILKKRLADSGAPLKRIRKSLEPMYRSLQAVFCELGDETAIAESEDPAVTPQDSHISEVWDSWKERLPGWPAKIITALQKHGSASTSQLMTLIGTRRRQTVHDSISKLNKASLISKSGDQFSLKKL